MSGPNKLIIFCLRYVFVNWPSTLPTARSDISSRLGDKTFVAFLVSEDNTLVSPLRICHLSKCAMDGCLHATPYLRRQPTCHFRLSVSNSLPHYSRAADLLNAFVYAIAVQKWNDVAIMSPPGALDALKCMGDYGVPVEGYYCLFRPMPHVCSFDKEKVRLTMQEDKRNTFYQTKKKKKKST